MTQQVFKQLLNHFPSGLQKTALFSHSPLAAKKKKKALTQEQWWGRFGLIYSALFPLSMSIVNNLSLIGNMCCDTEAWSAGRVPFPGNSISLFSTHQSLSWVESESESAKGYSTNSILPCPALQQQWQHWRRFPLHDKCSRGWDTARHLKLYSGSTVLYLWKQSVKWTSWSCLCAGDTRSIFKCSHLQHTVQHFVNQACQK